jgi:hypothetical protein
VRRIRICTWDTASGMAGAVGQERRREGAAVQTELDGDPMELQLAAAPAFAPRSKVEASRCVVPLAATISPARVPDPSAASPPPPSSRRSAANARDGGASCTATARGLAMGSGEEEEELEGREREGRRRLPVWGRGGVRRPTQAEELEVREIRASATAGPVAADPAAAAAARAGSGAPGAASSRGRGRSK